MTLYIIVFSTPLLLAAMLHRVFPINTKKHITMLENNKPILAYVVNSITVYLLTALILVTLVFIYGAVSTASL